MRGATAVLALARVRLRTPAGASGRRGVGDLPVKSDPNVERWGTSREHIEEGFRFDSANLRRGALWIVALPAAIYWGVTRDFAVVDERAGGRARKVMGGGAE